MPEYIVMPKLGLTMKYGTVVKWLKKEGDMIKKGEPIAEIATDKITNVVEAYCSGVLAKILVKENENANVGEPIGVIVKEGEDFNENKITKVDKTSNKSVTNVQERRIKASPVAKKLACEYNIDLSLVTATGPGGRITKEDVENYIKSLEKETVDIVEKKDLSFLKAERDRRSIKLTSVRKIIAERMTQSVREIPHVTEHIKVVADKLYALKEELSHALNIKLTFTDIISKLVVQAIKAYPLINSTMKNDEIIYLENINLGIAVATDNGLVVPVVKNAGDMPFVALVNTIRELTTKARTSRLTLEDVEEGTFTITNLGMYGIDSFTPIIFPGQTAILGVNTIYEELRYKDEKITTEKVLMLSLSFDHRVIDGAEAAKFLGIVKTNVEHPLKCFVG